MQDSEFDVLDELYFVTSYQDLENAVDFTDEEIRDTLIALATKDWIRIYVNMDEEVEDYDLIDNFKSYYYLASKKGLLAHNRQ